jgi:hypothetical protein
MFIKDNVINIVMNLKKGLSPLVSFILIIAFCVAIASLLYNLAIDLLEEPGSCITTELEETNICKDGNKVIIGVENKGTKVDKLLLDINSGDFSEELSRSSIRSGDSFNTDISYGGNIRSVVITPIVGGVNCEASLQKQNIRRCD